MRIVSFGCSLSQQGSSTVEDPNSYTSTTQKVGLIKTVSESLHIPYKNYAVSAGSMRTINHRFSTYMLEDYNPTDIILYQITSFIRQSYDFKIYPKLLHKNRYLKYYENADNQWFFPNSDGISSQTETYVPVSSLCNNPQFDNIFNPVNFGVHYAEYNYEINLTDTLANIKMIKNMGNPVLVFFGWYDALLGEPNSSSSPSYDYNGIFRKILKENNIDYVDKPYLDWCIDQKLPQTDSHHPCIKNAAPYYAQQVLLPKLTEIIKR